MDLTDEPNKTAKTPHKRSSERPPKIPPRLSLRVDNSEKNSPSHHRSALGRAQQAAAGRSASKNKIKVRRDESKRMGHGENKPSTHKSSRTSTSSHRPQKDHQSEQHSEHPREGDTIECTTVNETIMMDEEHPYMYPSEDNEEHYEARQTPHGFKGGKIYHAMYDYYAQTEYNLSFNRGDMLLVTEQSNSEWWTAHLGTKQGLVPSSHLCENTLTLGPWYFKDCSRRDAERLLMGAETGTFLVRNRDKIKPDTSATSIRSAYSLSVKTEEQYQTTHYKIEVVHSLDKKATIQNTVKTRFYITRSKRFKSLAHLVQYYSKHSELEVLLRHPCTLDQPTNTGLCIPGLRDKWEIPKSEIILEAMLGAGQFGEVWRAKWNNILDVAVKVMKGDSRMKKESFLMEARVMKQLHHRHLVQLYAVCSEDPMYIITELAEHGSLKSFLCKDSETFTTHFLTGLAGDVASGMAYLESKDFIHRDLAARNVLVAKNTICKICDFGLARWITTDSNVYQARRGSRFPIRWTAPEAIRSGVFSSKSDVWSYGILCYEIITRGKTPYKKMSNKEVVDFIRQGHRLEKPEGCPDWYYNMMCECWKNEPEDRPTFKKCLRVIHRNFTDEATVYLDATENRKSTVEGAHICKAVEQNTKSGEEANENVDEVPENKPNSANEEQANYSEVCKDKKVDE